LHLTSSANVGRIRLTSKLYIVLKTQVWKIFKLLDIYNKRHPAQSSPDKKKSQLQSKSFDNVDWICWQRCNHLQYRYRGYGGGGGGGPNVNRAFRKTTTSKNDCGRKKGGKMREKGYRMRSISANRYYTSLTLPPSTTTENAPPRTTRVLKGKWYL